MEIAQTVIWLAVLVLLVSAAGRDRRSATPPPTRHVAIT
jgi:hypothetical protein